MTKQDLINQRLETFPNEANDPDLEHNALAGYIRCSDGLYRDRHEYAIYLHYKDGVG